jgi:DNA repair photolyase
VEEKRQTEYYLLPVRSLLNRCTSERVPFPWTVNPYRGCEFGCRYCYARYTHEYMELEPEDFERKIYVKEAAGELAAREVASPSMRGQHIAIGTATDPYQPAEEQFGTTRAVLEAMAEREGLSVSIITKSNRVVRDAELIRRISEKSEMSVNLSVTTLNARLARRLEPRAPRPELRLAAVTKLREAGIAAGVFVMPVLPGITDRETDLDALARAARDAGAQWLAASVLFLMPSSLKVFLPFLEQEFPRLARRYREWYSRNAYAPEEYRKKISAQFAALRANYGLGSRPEPRAGEPSPASQLGLNWIAA